MSEIWPLLAFCVLLLGSLGFFYRANQLFEGRFERGVFRLKRGRCPVRLAQEIGEVARLEGLDSVTLSVRSVGGRPSLVTSGRISQGQEQQLRNVVGRFEVAQIRRGGRRA